MKRVLPFFFVLFFVFFIVARLMMTGDRAALVRTELARRGWGRAERIEPGTQSI